MTHESKQYGYALPYKKDDPRTLADALKALTIMLMDTIEKYGQARQAEWVCIDWADNEYSGPVLPHLERGMPFPPGWTCTVGWKAYFDGESVPDGERFTKDDMKQMCQARAAEKINERLKNMEFKTILVDKQARPAGQ